MHQCRWWHKIIQSIDSVSHISCHYLITAPQTIYFVNGWNMRVGVNCNIWLSWWESYYKGELTVTLIDFPITLVFNFWKFWTLSLTTVLPCRTTQDITGSARVFGYSVFRGVLNRVYGILQLKYGYSVYHFLWISGIKYSKLRLFLGIFGGIWGILGYFVDFFSGILVFHYPPWPTLTLNHTTVTSWSL